jgi:NTE family protein
MTRVSGVPSRGLDRSGGRHRIALVLAGGAARGAYEVGVLDYLLHDVARAIGRPVPLDILCGTSVGAINACALAAFADDHDVAMQKLIQAWQTLRVSHVVRVDTSEVLAVVRGIFGTRPPTDGGILDPAGLQRIVATAIPFPRIAENMTAGNVEAVTVSTTHVATGRTCVFVQNAGGVLPYWGRDETIQARPVTLTAVHALASAAIPFVFPAVPIDGELHCDGGLRQNVPLSPARRLGADGMIVISPRYVGHLDEGEAVDSSVATEPTHPGDPLFLLGKTLNALMLDRIDNDIDRLTRMTAVLEAGTRVYGADFVEKLNREMGRAQERAVRPIQAVLVRTSADISKMAAEFVRSPAFESRASGMVARLMRRLAEGSGRRGSDLLSYLLFDGEFARQLIEVGRDDARARHEELCGFFTKLDATMPAAWRAPSAAR